MLFPKTYCPCQILTCRLLARTVNQCKGIIPFFAKLHRLFRSYVVIPLMASHPACLLPPVFLFRPAVWFHSDYLRTNCLFSFLLTLATVFLEELHLTFFPFNTFNFWLCPTDKERSVIFNSFCLPTAWTDAPSTKNYPAIKNNAKSSPVIFLIVLFCNIHILLTILIQTLSIYGCILKQIISKKSPCPSKIGA